MSGVRTRLAPGGEREPYHHEEVEHFDTPLSDEEAQMLQGLVRQALRKTSRSRAGLIKQFGDEADFSSPISRAEMLEDIYRHLGGDPERIGNLDRWWADAD